MKTASSTVYVMECNPTIAVDKCCEYAGQKSNKHCRECLRSHNKRLCYKLCCAFILYHSFTQVHLIRKLTCNASYSFIHTLIIVTHRYQYIDSHWLRGSMCCEICFLIHFFFSKPIIDSWTICGWTLRDCQLVNRLQH